MLAPGDSCLLLGGILYCMGGGITLSGKNRISGN